MKRILILGSGGSGKTTLSYKIYQITGLPIIHLDEHYWNPNWVETPPEVWEQKVKKLIAKDTWIMDGNYGGTLNLRLARADAVIFLQTHRLRCILRVLYRNIRYWGKSRPSMAKDCPDRVTWQFIKYLWHYPNKNGPNALKRVAAYKGKIPIYQFKTKKEIKLFLQQLQYEHTN